MTYIQLLHIRTGNCSNIVDAHQERKPKTVPHLTLRTRKEDNSINCGQSALRVYNMCSRMLITENIIRQIPILSQTGSG